VRDTIWASIKTDWHTEAVCGGAADYLFFPSDETEPKIEKIRSLYCDLCPVQAKCLNSALINGDTGIWGGTSSAMRQAMLRTRTRAKCPVCQSTTMIETEATEDTPSYQVCLSCGVSWRSDTRQIETDAA
jgi:Zn ribbon nucleic-acid-binding protein